MSCGKSCAKHGNCGMSKKEVTAFWQLGNAVRSIDEDETLASWSAKLRDDKPTIVANLAWSFNARLLCKRAKAIVREVERMKKVYPAYADQFEGFMTRVVLPTLYPIYVVMCEDNICGYMPFHNMDNPYTYIKKMAKGADKIFEVECPKGFGVAHELGQVDFSDTQFICNVDEGISGMSVRKASPDVFEKVMVKNNSGGEFDYYKAAMALVLKAVFGGKSRGVTIVEYVAEELKKANEARIAEAQRKEELKAKKAEKKAQAEAVKEDADFGDGNEKTVVASAPAEPSPTMSVGYQTEMPEDEFAGEEKTEEPANDGKTRMEKELAPTHTDDIGFYQ